MARVNDSRLQVRLKAEELQLIQDASAKMHMTISEFSRSMLLLAARAALQDDPQKVAQVVAQTSFSFGTADVWGKRDDIP